MSKASVRNPSEDPESSIDKDVPQNPLLNKEAMTSNAYSETIRLLNSKAINSYLSVAFVDIYFCLIIHNSNMMLPASASHSAHP